VYLSTLSAECVEDQRSSSTRRRPLLTWTRQAETTQTLTHAHAVCGVAVQHSVAYQSLFVLVLTTPPEHACTNPPSRLVPHFLTALSVRRTEPLIRSGQQARCAPDSRVQPQCRQHWLALHAAHTNQNYVQVLVHAPRKSALLPMCVLRLSFSPATTFQLTTRGLSGMSEAQGERVRVRPLTQTTVHLPDFLSQAHPTKKLTCMRFACVNNQCPVKIGENSPTRTKSFRTFFCHSGPVVSWL
jgi:hypothetical protein